MGPNQMYLINVDTDRHTEGGRCEDTGERPTTSQGSPEASSSEGRGAEPGQRPFQNSSRQKCGFCCLRHLVCVCDCALGN